jgi:hypothetical protein
MVEYDAHGYDQVRSFVQSNWNWLAILDDSGTEHLRWDLTSNSNVTLESDATANPLEYTITITGQDLVDAGATLPVTLSEGELYETSSATTPIGQDSLRDGDGNATTATLEATSDTVDLTWTQAWPPQN